MKKQIANVVNFIRGTEPREPARDLVEPVRGQVGLLRQYGLKGTFLLQYDALLRPDILAVLRGGDNGLFEYGGWLEIMQPLVEDAGLTWRGKTSWDWHTDVGFSIGYTPEERRLLVDTFMARFRQVFGSYPQSMGSWVMDAGTLAYLAERYHIAAACNCKDQWGTDGYTLWGGYYGQAYYPSRRNAFAPAGREAEQIPVPVFRMLGSDPIYQYDLSGNDRFDPGECQGVCTLEPVYPTGGGSPEWVDWYMRENFTPRTLSFGYAQVGQENSFGWARMKDGLSWQMARLAQWQAQGRLTVQTLAESGKWYRARYPLTPASCVLAETDWQHQGRRSYWYCSRFYRINFFSERGKLWIRDLYRFDSDYEERYLTQRCETPACIYDNLPVMDGCRWSGSGVRAGIYPVWNNAGGQGGEPVAEPLDNETLRVSWPVAGAAWVAVCRPDALEISMSDHSDDWELRFATSSAHPLPLRQKEPGKAEFCWRGHSYWLRARQGRFSEGAGLRVVPEAGRICLTWR